MHEADLKEVGLDVGEADIEDSVQQGLVWGLGQVVMATHGLRDANHLLAE